MPASISQQHRPALLSLLIQRAPITVCPSALRSRPLPQYLAAACRACLVYNVAVAVCDGFCIPNQLFVGSTVLILKQMDGYCLQIMRRMDYTADTAASKRTRTARRRSQPWQRFPFGTMRPYSMSGGCRFAWCDTGASVYCV